MMMKRGKKRNEGKIVCDDNDERLCCSCHTRLILDDARKRKKVSYTKLLHETSAGKEVSWRTGEVKSEEYWMSPRLSIWCSFSRQQMKKKTAHRRWQCLLLVPSFQTFKRWISRLFRVEKTTQERERERHFNTKEKKALLFIKDDSFFALRRELLSKWKRIQWNTHVTHVWVSWEDRLLCGSRCHHCLQVSVSCCTREEQTPNTPEEDSLELQQNFSTEFSPRVVSYFLPFSSSRRFLRLFSANRLIQQSSPGCCILVFSCYHENNIECNCKDEADGRWQSMMTKEKNWEMLIKRDDGEASISKRLMHLLFISLLRD